MANNVTIYGKNTTHGMPIIYTDAAGNPHEGVVKNLTPIYKADLEVTIDGVTRFVEGSVYNEGALPGGWHHKEPQTAEEQAKDADAPPSPAPKGKK
jgi:hypothetical protein